MTDKGDSAHAPTAILIFYLVLLTLKRHAGVYVNQF